MKARNDNVSFAKVVNVNQTESLPKLSDTVIKKYTKCFETVEKIQNPKNKVFKFGKMINSFQFNYYVY